MALIVDSALVEGRLSHGPLAPDLTSTPTTLNGTLTLDVTSDFLQFLTGTATGYSLVLPAATSLVPGWRYEIYNKNSQPVVVKTNGGATLFTLSQDSIAYITLQANGTAAGTWQYWQIYTNVASGIVNYNVVASAAFVSSTRNPSWEMITGFTVTPVAGIYSVAYNASVLYDTTPKSHFWAVFKAGVIVADSQRSQDTAHSSQTMVDSTATIITVDGTQAVDLRVGCANTGSLTVNYRTLILVRLGG